MDPAVGMAKSMKGRESGPGGPDYSALGTVRIDALILHGFPVGAEGRVVIHAAVTDLRLEITRLFQAAAAGLTVAIPLAWRGFLGSAAHGHHPPSAVACKVLT